MRMILPSIFAIALLLSSAAGADPITLKLSFFTSDATVAYQAAIKPFGDAINRDGGNLVQIELYPSGTLGPVQKELPQLVLNSTADIAFIIPGQNPELFIDNAVIELPGLFRNVREATLAYTRLVEKGALAGYQDFFAIGVYATAPEVINSRKPLDTLADLKGQTIRTNNSTQRKALNKLGAVSRVLAFNETSAALAGADPIQLKLSFFASEQSKVYIDGIKPFVDAVNAEGKSLIAIEVHDAAALGELAEQPKLVLDNVTDIAWVVPGPTPYRFPDNELLELLRRVDAELATIRSTK